jgi:hypothetical protein
VSEANVVELDGLRGDNPLAFMAALGALVVAEREWPERSERQPVRLRWDRQGGIWRARLTLPTACSRDELAELLLPARARRLEKLRRSLAEVERERGAATERSKSGAAAERQKAKRAAGVLKARVEKEKKSLDRALESEEDVDPATQLGEHLKAVEVAKRFGAFVSDAADSASPGNRRLADLAAAFGCELVLDEAGDKLEPTRFSKQNGNSGKKMLADAAKLTDAISRERMAASLYSTWDYADEKYSLGWDPNDVRPYAHQATDPGDGSITMHGANLLAFESLALFPTAPLPHGKLGTTGYTRLADGECFTWPVWMRPLSREVIRSLLALPLLHEDEPSIPKLSAMGVGEVFRARHFSFFKSPRLTAARSV